MCISSLSIVSNKHSTILNKYCVQNSVTVLMNVLCGVRFLDHSKYKNKLYTKAKRMAIRKTIDKDIKRPGDLLVNSV